MTFKERYKYNPSIDLLGKGGFARVYKATDTVLDREVALKIFNVDTSNKCDLVSEIKKVIKLEHPNLCRYYDVAFLDSVSAFDEREQHQIGVLEYLDGGDLKSYCRAHPEQQLKLLTDVLKGLSFLHKRGIIHRDLKPQNILIKNTEDGPVAKITDFGISKDVGGSHTSSSLLMGTIEYMAPEQFSPGKYGIDGKIGTNLDLWSFGLMVYELVTGESLFGSRGGDSSAEQVMGNILSSDLLEDKIVKLPEPYLSVVRRCLIKDAKQRVQCADELIGVMGGGRLQEAADQSLETKVLFNSNAVETQILERTKVNEPLLSVSEDITSTDSYKRSKITLVIKGFLLLFFLTVHCFVNSLVFFNDDGLTFNRATNFMATNLLMMVVDFVIFISLFIYIFQTIKIAIQNRKNDQINHGIENKNARRQLNQYSIGLVCTLLIIFLIVHLSHFWVVSRFKGIPTIDSNGYENLYEIVLIVFHNIWIVGLYIISMVALSYYLLNTFNSALETIGWKNGVYFPVIKELGKWYSIVIPVVFAAIPIFIYMDIIK